MKWKTHDDAMADPLFQQARGIMGTANFGQDEGLRAAINHVLAALTGAQPAPAAPSDEVMLNGLTRAETDATASVQGLADSATASRALILLFRENAIPMSDRNSFLYTILEDALAPPPVLQIEALAHRHASRYIHGSSNPTDSASSEYTFNRATLLEFARALVAKETPHAR